MLVENWLTSSVKDRESALILRGYVVHGTFFELLCWNEYSYRLEAGVSENFCWFLKEVKPLVLYAVEHGIAMEQMRWKWASSCVDFGYTELLSIPELTSEFISSCDSVLGDSLVFYQENWGSLPVWFGTTLDCSAPNGRKSSLISQRGVCVMGFLEFRQEPGVYSRVTAGMGIRNSTLFSEVRTPV